MQTERTTGSVSSTTPWARSGCPPTRCGARRRSGRWRTSRSRAGAWSGHRSARSGWSRRAAARVNARIGVLGDDLAAAIAAAADEVAAGAHDAQFPIDVFQTGSGTSSNMNANEVIATLATRASGHRGAPERSRQRLAEQQRRVPHHDPPRRDRGRWPRTWCPRWSTSPRRCAAAPTTGPRSSRPAARTSWTRCRSRWARRPADGPPRPSTAPPGCATCCRAWPSCRSAAPRSAPGSTPRTGSPRAWSTSCAPLPGSTC